MTGNLESALQHIEHLLSVPGLLSPGWLKIDPTFGPLRNHPGFERLVSGT
jgi:hypothetical protein